MNWKLILTLLVLASPVLADDTDRKIRELEERIENLEDGMTPQESHDARELLGLNTDPVPFQCNYTMTEEVCASLKKFHDKIVEDLDAEAGN